MKIDTEVIRAEPHVEIGALLQRNADVIIDRWCAVARDELTKAQRVHYEVLRDDLPAFLHAMGRALTEAAPGSRPGALAREHGTQRWEHGWSLTELVRDYQLLRLVILEFLEENLARPLVYREGLAVGVFVDDAVAASISRYVAQRDEQVLGVERDRAQALEDLSRRKDEFLAILGHELRNPLAPIRNSLVVIRKLTGTHHPALATSLDVLDRQTQQLGRLVDDLLDLARISRGEFELRKEVMDMRPAIDQAVHVVESLVKERRHNMHVSLPAVAVHLDADPDRVCQIAANLLTNAAKYTEPGGNIWLNVEAENDAAVLRVRDDGIGIAPEMLASVFELFARVDRPDEAGKLDGLGIGLALVQRLVKQHGGTIAAKSEGLGHGTEFVVRLPKAGVTLAQTHSAATPAERLVITQIPVAKA